MRLIGEKLVAYTLLIVLVASLAIIVPRKVGATLVGFPKLSIHGIDNWASSLKVQGTVILYELEDYQGFYVEFTNDEPHLVSMNDLASSLKVDGSVTLYELYDYGGNLCAFTSESDPNEDLGATWNSNPNLLTREGNWDSREWHWDLSSLELEGGDGNNYVNWYDGYVDSRSEDYPGTHWAASNFDQGYWTYERQVPNLGSLGWDNCISSLRVRGTVTLYSDVNYGGTALRLGPYQGKDGWIPDLRVSPYYFNDEASSLRIEGAGVVTVYDAINYQYPTWGLRSFVSPSNQPFPLYWQDAASITLEGMVYGWEHTGDSVAATWWDGAKFDVWACENYAGGAHIMMELYFLRGGLNLAWPSNPYPKGNSYMCAIDALPLYANRTVHSGDVCRWQVDIKSLLERAALAYNIDPNILKIYQISFTVEAGTNLNDYPFCHCKCKKLRLCYMIGGGGGCPILSAFNGSKYVDEGLLDIHNPNGEDVIAQRSLVTSLQPVNNAYLLRLTEHQKTHSYIDQVKLFAILEDGSLIVCPLIWAKHSEYGYVLPKLLLDDEWKTETIGADLNGGTSQYIDLRFLALPKHLKLLGFRFYIEGNNPVMK